MNTESTEEFPATEEIVVVTDYLIAKKLVQLKQSADSRGVEFNLSFNTVKKLLNAKTCYYTRKKFGEGVLARSIDRVDSSLGYIDNNVVACTIEINQKKSNLEIDDILLMAKRIQDHKSKQFANDFKFITKALKL